MEKFPKVRGKNSAGTAHIINIQKKNFPLSGLSLSRFWCETFLDCHFFVSQNCSLYVLNFCSFSRSARGCKNRIKRTLKCTVQLFTHVNTNIVLLSLAAAV